MTNTVPDESARIGFRLVEAELLRLDFALSGQPTEEPIEPQFGLRASIAGERILQVRMLALASQEGCFESTTEYSGLFEIEESVTEEDLQEVEGAPKELLQHFAAKVAPSVLYPFIRETLASITGKAGLPPVLLPIINWGNVFEPEDIELVHEDPDQGSKVPE